MKTTQAITFWILRHPSGQSSLFASLRPRRGFGLDRPCGAPPEGNYVMARGICSDEQLELNPHSGTKGGVAMFDRTPSAVDVTIGGETRIYEAFVTTAPVTLDRPSTVTELLAMKYDIFRMRSLFTPFEEGCKASISRRRASVGVKEWQKRKVVPWWKSPLCFRKCLARSIMLLLCSMPR